MVSGSQEHDVFFHKHLKNDFDILYKKHVIFFIF